MNEPNIILSPESLRSLAIHIARELAPHVNELVREQPFFITYVKGSHAIAQVLGMDEGTVRRRGFYATKRFKPDGSKRIPICGTEMTQRNGKPFVRPIAKISDLKAYVENLRPEKVARVRLAKYASVGW